ncbi:glycosyltransferase [Gallaecimonas pentaromativorans]|uniref:glycosyltransferase n=1 Tax=Gallaecimonas pentaromativorans TaxID=584787 RepID=UPI00067F3401|nr:glycosyltransferase [Gallaecimonas pentaromativorans]
MHKLAVVVTIYNESLSYVRSALSSIYFDIKDIEDVGIFIGVDRPLSEVDPKLYKYLTRVSKIENVKVIFFNENRGLAVTLNDMIFNHCYQYSYIARMDADDIVIPGRFKAQISYLDAHRNVDLIGGKAFLIDDLGNDIGKFDVPKFISLKWGNQLIHPTWMFRRSLFVELSGYRNYAAAQDFDFLARAVSSLKKIENIPCYFIKYRIRNNSVGNEKKLTQLLYKIEISKAFRNKSILLNKVFPKERGFCSSYFLLVEKFKRVNVFTGRLMSLFSLIHLKNYYLLLRKKIVEMGL